MEIVSISDDNNTFVLCQKPPDYPLMTEGSVGTVIRGRPLICGGRFDGDYYDECFAYDRISDTWVIMPRMLEARAFASAVSVNEETWWITGGVNEVGGNLSSTEILRDGVFSRGPELPEGLAKHCVAFLNESHVFLAGGETDEGGYSNATWMMEWPSGEWIRQRDRRTGT